MSSEGSSISPIGRILNFAGGFLIGLVLPMGMGLAVVLLVLVLADLRQKPAGPSKPFVLTASGADVSNAGGVALEVRALGDELRLDCRGACDDLSLQNEIRDLDSVRVLNAQGGCVACNDVSGPYQRAGSRRWSVSGEPKLTIRQGDGA